MSSSFSAPPKDPSAILRHAMDWIDWLDQDETITVRSVTSNSPALVVDQVADLAGVVSWRVSGGLQGTNPVVTVEVQTSAGRIDQRSVTYRIRNR